MPFTRHAYAPMVSKVSETGNRSQKRAAFPLICITRRWDIVAVIVSVQHFPLAIVDSVQAVYILPSFFRETAIPLFVWVNASLSSLASHPIPI